jgi:ribosomal protein S27E
MLVAAEARRADDSKTEEGLVVLFQTAIVTVAMRKALERQCEACGHKQVFPPSRKREAVSCPRCKTIIPPKKQR